MNFRTSPRSPFGCFGTFAKLRPRNGNQLTHNSLSPEPNFGERRGVAVAILPVNLFFGHVAVTTFYR